VETHIVERLAEFINNGELDCEMIHVESEHSALSAAIGSEATGVRTFTATASQGLALMHEILFVVSGMRLPVVMGVANRTLSAPINIWNDHQDSISARDSGWLQFYAESAQEALDTVIMAYKIAENKDVLLPAMVCIDGFTLSHVYEPVNIPEQMQIDKFLKAYKPVYKLDPAKPVTMGPVGFPDSFMFFKQAQQKAMDNAIPIIKRINKMFKLHFNRGYGNGLIETYKMNDAKYAVIAMGSVCGTARVAVDSLRKKGKKAGLIKVKTFRPFPKDILIEATKNLKGVAILDKDVSLGNYGALFTEVRAVLPDKIKVNDFIIGLGGRDITVKHIERIFDSIGRKQDIEWVF
tara:strand:- start:22197 stop:23246 length:1050 start_codon:yes stop_codon:yes gene_type:complete